MRTIPNAAHLFEPVEDIIGTKFIPSIFGQEIFRLDRQLYALPIRDGGLGYHAFLMIQILRLIQRCACPEI